MNRSRVRIAVRLKAAKAKCECRLHAGCAKSRVSFPRNFKSTVERRSRAVQLKRVDAGRSSGNQSRAIVPHTQRVECRRCGCRVWASLPMRFSRAAKSCRPLNWHGNRHLRFQVSLDVLPGGISLRLRLLATKEREGKSISDFQPMERAVKQRLGKRTNQSHRARGVRVLHVERCKHARVRIDHGLLIWRRFPLREHHARHHPVVVDCLQPRLKIRPYNGGCGRSKLLVRSRGAIELRTKMFVQVFLLSARERVRGCFDFLQAHADKLQPAERWMQPWGCRSSVPQRHRRPLIKENTHAGIRLSRGSLPRTRGPRAPARG